MSVYLDPNFLPHYLFLISFGKISWGDTADRLICARELPKMNSNPCLSSDGSFRRIDAMHNESATRTLLENSMTESCPLVIENPFADQKCLDRLVTLADNTSNTVRVKENWQSLYDKRDLWYDDGKPHTNSSTQFDEMPLKELLAELMTGASTKHISFERSMGVSTYDSVWGFDLKWLKGMSSSNFMSHYNATVVTSPMHSAMWESFAFQCKGTKVWRFLQPQDNYATMSYFLTGFTFTQNCNARPDVDARTTEVTVGPGELLYFPPYWAHSVQTTAGLSILMNYRSLDLGSLFWRSPALAVHTVTALLFHMAFFTGRDPVEIHHYYEKGAFPANIKDGKSDGTLGELFQHVWGGGVVRSNRK